MATRLPDDFPGRAALDEAGEATPAKVRKRIAAGTLTEIPGIGEATADKIIEAFNAFDSPALQAEEGKEIADDANITPASQAAAVREQQPGEAETGSVKADDFRDDASAGVLLNQGGPNPAAVAAGEQEAAKTGAQKNVELPNHDLAELTPAERAQVGAAQSEGERLAKSGAVWVDGPQGPYVSATAVHIPDSETRRLVKPISAVAPRKGMRVIDGNDEYAVQEPFGMDANPSDWLKVRSPNTGKAFIQ